MLQNLHVKNLALIDEAEVDFERGLNILYREDRCRKINYIRFCKSPLEADILQIFAEGSVRMGWLNLFLRLHQKNQELGALQTLDVYPEDGAVILSRKLMEGRQHEPHQWGNSFGRKLKEIAAVLIDIHGQHEHQSLLYKKNHLQILDEFAKEELGTR